MESLYYNGKHHCALYKGSELVWEKPMPDFKVWSGGMEEPEREDWKFYVDKPEHWAWIAHKISTQRHFMRDKGVFLRADLDFNNIPMYPMSGCSQDGKAQYDWTATIGLEGGNHIVKNMNMKAYSGNNNTYCSIFGGDWLSEINNVTFKDITLEGGKYTGILFNSGTGVKTNNVTITGNINILKPTYWFGGIIALPYGNVGNQSIHHHNKIKITVNSEHKVTFIGGIAVASANYLTINDNIVDITLNTPTNTPVDFYGGMLFRSTIQDVVGVKIYNNIHASKKITAGSLAGGIIGGAYKPLKADDHFISHNINLADISAPTAGGIIGYTSAYVNIDYCYNRGNINEDKPNDQNRYSSGIISYHVGNLTMTNCVNDGVINADEDYNTSSGLVNIDVSADTVNFKNNMVFKGGKTGFLYNPPITNLTAENNLTVTGVPSGDVGVVAGFERVENREELLTHLPADYKVCESGNITLNKIVISD